MTVTAYEAEFTNLVEYAPHIVADEIRRPENLNMD